MSTMIALPASAPAAVAAPARLEVRQGIDIWLTFYDEIVDPAHHSRLRLLLTPEEAAQEHRFYFEHDRRRYLVTRAMVRLLLSRYAPVAPERWAFSKNAYGRPAIAEHITADEPAARDLRFNISHTRGLIVLAVTRGRELGVDVENLAVRNISLDVADRFFSPSEAAELMRHPKERQQERFFEYWTFKESYIKARGMGLSLPLDGFSFDFPKPETVRIDIDPSLEDSPERWNFWQCRPSPEHLMAICAERETGVPPPISMRRYIPFASETSVIAPFARVSEVA